MRIVVITIYSPNLMIPYSFIKSKKKMNRRKPIHAIINDDDALCSDARNHRFYLL